jgi:hypothetical protein
VRVRRLVSARVRRRLPVEQKIGDDLPELLILIAELSDFAQTAHRDGIVLIAPAVERGLRYGQLPAHVHGGRSRLDLLERLHDLVFGEFAWSHRLIPPSHMRFMVEGLLGAILAARQIPAGLVFKPGRLRYGLRRTSGVITST